MDGEPRVVQHGGPRLRFGERAMIYKVHSWAYPGCQCTLSTKSFSLYFPILCVIPWVTYLQMYPSASWGGSLSRETLTKEGPWLLTCLLRSKAESYHAPIVGARCWARQLYILPTQHHSNSCGRIYCHPNFTVMGTETLRGEVTCA